MSFRQFFLISAFILTSYLANAQQGPSQVSITRVDSFGSGCKPNTVASTISPDAQELSLLFDDFVSETGGPGQADVDKKLCQIGITLSIPVGWQMGLIAADYRGFAAVEVGAQAQHEVLYSFDRSYAGNFKSSVIGGDHSDNYYFHNEISPALVNWSDCNARAITLNMRVTLVTQVLRLVNGVKPSAMMSLDSVDTAVQQSFQVAWRNCQGRPVTPTPPQPVEPPRPPDFRPPPQGDYADLYQMFDGRTRYLTSDPRQMERGAWVNQGLIFKIFNKVTREFRALPLYQCLQAQTQRYFVTTDARCEGQRMERQLGYISQNQLGIAIPLYEMMNPNDVWDRAVTTNPAQYQGYRQNRILGYVLNAQIRVNGGQPAPFR